MSSYIARFALWNALLALAAATPTPSNLGLKKFTSLVVFGDSWTDSGLRDYAPDANGNIGQPSNRASTGGRVWPQYIEQYAGVNSYDYAVSGAVCDATHALNQRNGILQNQVPTFLSNRQAVNPKTGTKALNIPKSETAYAIWIGTNDLGNGVFLAERQPKGVPVTAYIDCVYAQLDNLYEIGARHFVIMNAGPLDLIPQYALPENGGVDVSRFWTDKLNYNANITQTSEKMRSFISFTNYIYNYKTFFDVVVAKRYRGSTFALFDTHALMTDIWHNPANYLNGTAPFNVTSSVVQCGPSCNALNIRDSFMWYDELHPSEQTDRVVAREFVKVVKGGSQWATYIK
ncbi:GDSL Lipase/Acylhydrolase family protein [Stachybotrys elegans]|uniref:GDSL Lipase/Acylhydrolase family protein n=1 Tax=Stachybotrys elegans TaxID=80388 RepID=A0A8K0WXE4_9HYPO|nr:GDSL Lipase/Acylhydrolase family protein [Stachybotrys elegans]